MAGLNELVEKTTKKFGEGRMLAGSAPGEQMDYPRQPTYIFPLDYALGGGVPFNVCSQFYGPFQGGKTSTAYLLARAVSRTCAECLKPLLLCTCKDGPRIAKTFLCHGEGRPDYSYLQALGYDMDQNLVCGFPEYGEQACQMIEDAVKADDCGLVIMDSLASIVPRTVLEGEYEDINVGGQAKLLTKLFHRLNHTLVAEYRRGHLVAVVFLNQMRALIGGGSYGPTETVPGGWAAKHGMRLSMRIGQLTGDAAKDEVDKSSNMKNVLRFSASMLGPQSKQQLFIMAGKCEYKFTVGEYDGCPPGTILDAATTVKIARELGILAKAGETYRLEGTALEFQKLADVEEMFKAGQYVDPKTGEVSATGGFDDAFRYKVLTYAKDAALRETHDRMERRVRVLPPRCREAG